MNEEGYGSGGRLRNNYGYQRIGIRLKSNDLPAFICQDNLEVMFGHNIDAKII